jgi:hypothetical protein
MQIMTGFNKFSKCESVCQRLPVLLVRIRLAKFCHRNACGMCFLRRRGYRGDTSNHLILLTIRTGWKQPWPAFFTEYGSTAYHVTTAAWGAQESNHILGAPLGGRHLAGG